MIHMESQNQVLKTAWIPKCLQIEGVWRKYVTRKIQVDIRYKSRCYIRYADIPFKFPKESIWNEVWLNWCPENYNNNIETGEQILNQNIWYNSHIRRNDKTLQLKQWETKGIRWISDLMYEDDKTGTLRFLSQAELETMYNIKTDFVTYWGFLHSIPKVWRNTLMLPSNTTTAEDEEGDYKLVDKLMDAKQPSRLIYDCKIKNKSYQATCKMEGRPRDPGQ